MSYALGIVGLKNKASSFNCVSRGLCRRSVASTDSLSSSATNFFNDGGVANSIGENFEKDVRFYLFDRGYRPFLRHESPRSVTSYVEIYDDNKNLFDEGSKSVEIDPSQAPSKIIFVTFKIL